MRIRFLQKRKYVSAAPSEVLKILFYGVFEVRVIMLKLKYDNCFTLYHVSIAIKETENPYSKDSQCVSQFPFLGLLQLFRFHIRYNFCGTLNTHLLSVQAFFSKLPTKATITVNGIFHPLRAFHTDVRLSMNSNSQ